MILSKCRTNGLTPISTFISPLEQMLFDALAMERIPMICAIPDSLNYIHRPTVKQTPLFAENRLLLISKMQGEDVSREIAWHKLNEDIAQLARASNGEALYLR